MKTTHTILHTYLHRLFLWLAACSIAAQAGAQELALEKVIPLRTAGVNLNHQTMMRTDQRGNTYLAGSFKDKLTLAGKTFTSSATDNLFLIKFSALGNVQGAVSLEVSFDTPDDLTKAVVRDMTIDADENVFFIAGTEGNSGGSLLVKDSRTTSEPYSFDSQDDFLIKYDSKAGTVSPPRKIPDLDNAGSITNKGNKVYLVGNSVATQEIFLDQYDNDLVPLTDRKTLIQTTATGSLLIRRIAIDSQNNLFLAGTFRGPADFGTVRLSSRNYDVYLARFDNAGNFSFVRQIASKSKRINVKDMVVDEKGRVYLTGLFNGKISFPFPSITDTTSIESQDDQVDIYFASYDGDGETLRYAYPLNGEDYDEPTAIAVTDAYFYLTGYIKNSINFDVLGERDYPLGGGGRFDAFIAKYEQETARLEYAALLESDDNSDSNRSGDLAIHTDADGQHDIYTSGYFSGNTTFDPYTGESIENGNKDIFWAKYIEKVSKADQSALEKLYDETDGQNSWSNKSGWLQKKTPIEQWYGITVSANKRITGIDLSNNGLKGTIPKGLDKINRGQKLALDLSSNQLEGKIPELTATTINLSGNLFTFKDLVPFLATHNAGVTYAPQAPVGKAETVRLKASESRTFSIPANAAPDGNQYLWYKDGVATNSKTNTITLTAPQDVGTYVCKITNPGAPALTLESRPVTVRLEGQADFAQETIPGKATDLSVYDLDSDGDQDFVTTFRNEALLDKHLNNGVGVFTESAVSGLLDMARVVRVADLNGDGFPDLLTGYNRIIVYWGDAGQTFPTNTVIEENAESTYELQTADLDGDGDTDVLAGYKIANQLVWYENTGAKSFNRKILAINNPYGVISITTPDMDGDGRPDVVGAYRETSDLTDAPGGKKIVYFRNLGGGNFSPEATITNAIEQPETVFSADLNGDRKPDILLASSSDNTVSFYLNESEGDQIAFSARKIIASNITAARSVFATDMDGDGDQDVLTGTFENSDQRLAGTYWFQNNGDDTFTEKFLGEGHIKDIAATDVDNDGDQDVLVVKILDSGEIVLFRNQRQAATQPGITAFVPTVAEAGQRLTVYGASFGSNSSLLTVALGGQTAEAVAVSEGGTQLQTTVPAGLAPGQYTITVAFKNGTPATSTQKLTVTPRLDRLSETTGMAGSPLTAYGNNLQGNLVAVRFGNTEIPAGSLTVNPTSITFNVPALDSGLYEVQVIVNEVASVVLPFRVVKEEVPEDSTPPQIVALDIPPRSEQKAITATLEVADAESDTLQVTLAYAGLTGTLGEGEPLAVTANNRYTLTLPAAAFDELGVQYKVVVINEAGLSVTTTDTIYRNYPSQQLTLYDSLKAQPEVVDYQIIALPFTSQTVASLWGKDYDIKQWRLFGYDTDSAKYQEYKAEGFTSFEPGKGYMFIQRAGFKLHVKGEVVKPDYEIALEKGYNLIGNPYPFNIDWNAVQSANPGLGDIVTYRKGKIDDNSTELRAYEGGFLAADQDRTIIIPVTAKNARQASQHNKARKNALTASSWFVNLDVTGKDFGYLLAGFGMHERAQPGEDRLDARPVPRFLSYLEGSFRQPIAGDRPLAKDVVPTAEAHIWDFEVASNLPMQQVTLSWDNSYFGDNDKQLMLLDRQNYRVVNMREQQEYRFVMQEGVHPFRVFFGTEETITQQMLPERIVVGAPYPNPAAGEVFIPVSLPESPSTYAVYVTVLDQTGRQVALLNQPSLPAGLHTLRWNRRDDRQASVAPGLYFYQVSIAGDTQVYRGKIWLQ